MSKKAHIQTLQPQPNGPIYGQKARTADFNYLQTFARQHVESMTKDFLIDEQGVVGFDYTLVGGNSRQIHINDGRAYNAGGIQYDHEEIVTLTFQAADLQPRIDIIVATLQTDVAAENESVAFARIRTQTELEQSVAPFVPTQFNVPTQLHNTVTLKIIKGAAAVNPVVPAHGANEVVLYQVAIPANSSSVVADNITDVRPKILTIKALTDLVGNALDIIKSDGNGEKFLADDGIYRNIAFGVIQGAVPGSIMYAGANGKLSQDNTKLFYDYANGRLGLGINAALAAMLHISSTTNQIRVGYDAVKYADFTVNINGNLAITPTGDKIQIGTILQFGGSSVAFPSLKRNAAGLEVRLADDSALADLKTAYLIYRKPRKDYLAGEVIASTNSNSVGTGDGKLEDNAPAGVILGFFADVSTGAVATIRFPSGGGGIITDAGKKIGGTNSYITLTDGYIELTCLGGNQWVLSNKSGAHTFTLI